MEELFLQAVNLATAVGTAKIYIDGAEKASVAGTTGNISADGQSIQVGKRNVYFNGQIDELRIYNRVLTPEEIAGLNSANCVP